jgi:hypothetical protein
VRKTLEDRKYERFDVEGEVDLRVIFTKSADVMEVRARLKNVGTGGLYIETKEALPPGALADLNLKLEGKVANTLGLIRWLNPGEGAGIEFFYATEEERDALREHLIDWVRTEKKRRGSRDG